MSYISELRAETKALRRSNDMLHRALEDSELIISRLQLDRDELQEIVFDLADKEEESDDR